MGPLITKQHLHKVEGYIDVGVEQGATLLVDGRGLTPQGYENGYFIGGSLFDHVTPHMRIYKEESLARSLRSHVRPISRRRQ
jgi:malonate-semialdehyde dehydrogenase (acetylating)/methylmalonate-semialdehyde dehydrogenase